MATNVITRLRDYLAARDLPSEVAGGLVVAQSAGGQSALEQSAAKQSAVAQSAVAQFDVDRLSAQPLPLERLPAPLPRRVRSVAQTSLVVFGAWFAVGALYVIVGLVAVVLMPIRMGREGVGTAMITMFTVCVTAVFSGIQLLAARSAARVIRREERGVRALYLFSVFAMIALAVALGIVWSIKVAFFGNDASGDTPGFALTAVSIVLSGFIVWFARVAFVLRNYARHLRNNSATT